MNEIGKVVFSSAGPDGPAALPDSPGWDAATVVSGDLAERLGELKAVDGPDLLVHGGSSFARDVVATGLLDEYRLVVHPVVLGSGRGLFDAAAQIDLQLVEATTFDSGTAAMVYRPA